MHRFFTSKSRTTILPRFLNQTNPRYFTSKRNFLTTSRPLHFTPVDDKDKWRTLSSDQKENIMTLKEKHPREWAIFSSIDTNNDGVIDRDELRYMCNQFGVGDLADTVVEILDADNDGAISFQELLGAFADIRALRTEARLRYWNSCFGLGVAGNVAGHMAQAGEADEDAPPQTLPAAVFAFYVPQGSKERLLKNQSSKASILRRVASSSSQERLERELDRLERFPVTNAVIDYPDLDGSDKVQVEPEFALLCDIVYRSDAQESKKVEMLLPRKVAAFNDCSIRELDGSEKLSEKKNWGFGSKGISLDSFHLDSPGEFSRGGIVSHLALTSYLKRDSQIHQYTISAPGRNYLLFYEELLDWICEQLNEQTDVDKWENMAELLQAANYPSSMWIALGAGEYTPWGEHNYIQPKDECVVVIYDEQHLPEGPSLDQVSDIFEDKEAGSVVDGKKTMVYLHQTFVEPGKGHDFRKD